VALKAPAYDLRMVHISDVDRLCAAHHGYGGAGRIAVYAFGVFERGVLVAAYAWQPPPPGAARSVCPEAPAGVLALSRMVAVPRSERLLQHVSTPLRRQMRTLIDRGRWPVLVTYSDASLGHTGHVYRCSGWARGATRRARYHERDGKRISSYSAGASSDLAGTTSGVTELTRWEHRACGEGEAAAHMAAHGWEQVPIPGKLWRSGAQAHKWVQRDTAQTEEPPWR